MDFITPFDKKGNLEQYLKRSLCHLYANIALMENDYAHLDTKPMMNEYPTEDGFKIIDLILILKYL